MGRNIEQIGAEFVEFMNSTKDYLEITKSQQYKTLGLLDPVYPSILLKKMPLIIKGDVREIRLEQFNTLRVIVAIDAHSDGFGPKLVAMNVSGKDREMFLNGTIKPDTCICAEVQLVKLELTAVFEFKSLVYNKEDLMFPYYVCTGDHHDVEDGSCGCKRIYGWQETDRVSHCMLCGSSVKPVHNVYSEEFAEYRNK